MLTPPQAGGIRTKWRRNSQHFETAAAVVAAGAVAAAGSASSRSTPPRVPAGRICSPRRGRSDSYWRHEHRQYFENDAAAAVAGAVVAAEGPRKRRPADEPFSPATTATAATRTHPPCRPRLSRTPAAASAGTTEIDYSRLRLSLSVVAATRTAELTSSRTRMLHLSAVRPAVRSCPPEDRAVGRRRSPRSRRQRSGPTCASSSTTLKPPRRGVRGRIRRRPSRAAPLATPPNSAYRISVR